VIALAELNSYSRKRKATGSDNTGIFRIKLIEIFNLDLL
jgi:hypothetical protein